MPPQSNPPSAGVKWNEVTWYSKLGAVIFFLGVVPLLCFYIGIQYEKAFTENDNLLSQLQTRDISRVDTLNSPTLIPIGSLFASDTQYIYYLSYTDSTGAAVATPKWRILTGADPATFLIAKVCGYEILGEVYYAMDYNHVYKYTRENIQPEVIPDVDPNDYTPKC